MERLANLKKHDCFIIPGYTDALPTENSGEGRLYLYHVTGVMPNGNIKVYNKDLRMFQCFPASLSVEKL